MARVNTLTSYGSVTKSFHWLTALLILSMIPLGFFANQLAYQIKDPAIPTTGEDIARVAWLFSLHKTVGVALFFTALARITWAISQPKPKLLNGDKPLEAFAASTVHWVLYSALVIVPLSGWIHHAATTGFAPIWWPLGQSLPFVPKDELLAEQTAIVHWLSCIVLVGALVLHIGGAVKHHVIDQDATLRRMLPGLALSAEPTTRQPGEVLPIMAAVSAWAGVIFIGGYLTLVDHSIETVTDETATLETVDSDWVVTDGTLDLSVTQFGSKVEGGFSDWTAAIEYNETPDAEGKHGTVTVTINVASLTMGSVTDQAKDTDYFDLANHPTATFEADILRTEEGHIAEGTLSVKDQTVPVRMPFELSLDGDTANASGGLTVDRRDFLIGMGTQDDATLSFAVEIAFALTATRGAASEET
ncbi:MAG: cytochrome b/b6 domain-containing protein, partial [Pseudomonadota bacterium]